jgi:hypothetical protein
MILAKDWTVVLGYHKPTSPARVLRSWARFAPRLTMTNINECCNETSTSQAECAGPIPIIGSDLVTADTAALGPAIAHAAASSVWRPCARSEPVIPARNQAARLAHCSQIVTKA